MRKLIVSNLVSLDGFIAGPDGNLMVMPFDETFSQRNAALLRDADTLLLGRRTYTEFAHYWPQVAADRQQPAVEREISRLNAKAHKVVVSEILAGGIGAWADTTEVVRPEHLVTRVNELKAESRKPGKKTQNIVTFGSATLVRSLLQLGLVDELQLQVGANAVGRGGRPLFDGPIPGRITLVDASVPEGSQNAVLTYALSPE
ncbi:MAG TPA: dihydrofolate reductase family protein [Aeromicrobium sp.]|nr:dihydrofolate reductase family protein [Aeromicrobium sp.]